MVVEQVPAQRIGWIGLGKMGRPLAQRLIAAGHHVIGHDPQPPEGDTITLASDPAALAAQCDVIFCMLPGDDTLVATAAALAGRMRPGATLIDMSTVSPAASARAAALLGPVPLLRAPVSGSTVLAATGGLSILVSGPEAVFAARRDLLAHLGRKLTWLGPAEEARVAKLVINTLVAATNTALAEALNLGHRAGLDWESMIDLIADSVVGSGYVASKVGTLKSRDWTPAATVSLLTKDLDLALDLGRSAGANLPMAALSRQLLTLLEARGQSGRDIAAILTVYEDQP